MNADVKHLHMPQVLRTPRVRGCKTTKNGVTAYYMKDLQKKVSSYTSTSNVYIAINDPSLIQSLLIQPSFAGDDILG